jgi:predicted permease
VSALKGQAGQPSGARAAARFRTTLATVQIALSMALLVAAGLFTRSLANVSRVDLGARIDHVVQFRLLPHLNGYDTERTRAFYERLEDELLALPGTLGVTSATVALLSNSSSGNDVTVEGFPAGTDMNSRTNRIGPDYFKTLGMSLVAGREFTRADAAGAPLVAVVNEAFARKFNLAQGAVGKRIGLSDGKLDMEIVGLVRDTKYNDVKRETPPIFFTPYRQLPRLGALTLYVRSSLAPDVLLPQLPKLVARLDPTLPVVFLRTLPDQVGENVYVDRLVSTLSAAFAGLATLLAAIGLYGVLAYTVAQRTREIGLRMALGAAPGRVRSMVLRQVGAMTLVGGAAGLLAALWLGRLAESLLFQLKGSDPAVLSSSVVLLSLVALAAGLVPALRASRIHPMQALRYE